MKRIAIGYALFILALLATPAAAQSDSRTLSETYTSDDQLLTVHYPTGWYANSEIDGQVHIATTEDTIRLDTDRLESGSAGVTIMYALGKRPFNSAAVKRTNPLAILNSIIDGYTSYGTRLRFDEAAEITFSDHPAARVNGRVRGNEFFIIVVNDAVDHFILVLGYAAHNELSRYEPKLLAIAESADYQNVSNL